MVRKRLTQLTALGCPFAGKMTSGKMTSGEMKAATVIYLFTCAVTSSSLNGIVIYVFTKIGLKKLNCKDALVFSTSIGDFIQSLLGYSLEIYATVSTKNQAVKTGNSFCKVIRALMLI